MEFNIFHDFPTNGKNMILLPFGLYYNVELKNASPGDTLVFLGGEKRTLIDFCFLDLESGIADMLSRYLYRTGISSVIKKWRFNAVFDGYGKLSVSDKRCYCIRFNDENGKET